jgi:hypothetical protein
MKRRFVLNTVFALILAMCLVAASAAAAPWKFGVISDTQWTTADPANQNPNTIPASIIKQINQQFININHRTHDLKFVIAVGDMVDTGSQTNDYTRALYAQDLYNAGIGFYPMRGNHEAANGSYMYSDADFWHAYPQIRSGLNNATPSDITTSLIPAAVLAANPPAGNTRKPFKVGFDFSYPTAANSANNSVSYSFQWENATFLILDQFKSPDYYTSHIIPEQQDWIRKMLSHRPGDTHAFAFTHKNILGGNHKDNMFGGNATDDPGDGYGIDPLTVITNTPGLTIGAKQAAENTFLSLLQTNDVKYMISGHDHHHYNSVVTSPDQRSKVHQLITQSDSSKFYTPKLPVSPNDVPVEQDLGRIGYYIFTVDGPRVTIDYYADTHGQWQSDGSYPYGNIDLVNYPVNVTPTLTFAKRSTTGYSLNGKEKLVPQNGSYAMSDDTKVADGMEPGFLGTSMSILWGTNGRTGATNYGKALTKAVNTGWAPAERGLSSDILSLWGMADVGTDQTDVFTLSLTYDPRKAPRERRGEEVFGLATKDGRGHWINAVDGNFGGAKKIVKGAWKPEYGLGTYGVDPATKTVWAVINHNSDFAVASFEKRTDGKDKEGRGDQEERDHR